MYALVAPEGWPKRPSNRAEIQNALPGPPAAQGSTDCVRTPETLVYPGKGRPDCQARRALGKPCCALNPAPCHRRLRAAASARLRPGRGSIGSTPDAVAAAVIGQCPRAPARTPAP